MELLILIGLMLFLGLVGVIIVKGKDLLKLQMLQGSFFKQVIFAFSTPANAQKVIYFSESGTVTQEFLPVHDGWIDRIKENSKQTWLLVHGLKVKVCKDDEQFQDEEVLLLTSRSYIPYDPFNVLGDQKGQLTSLSEIGGIHHDQVMFETGRKDTGDTIQRAIINSSFVFLIILTIAGLLMRVWVK